MAITTTGGANTYDYTTSMSESISVTSGQVLVVAIQYNESPSGEVYTTPKFNGIDMNSILSLTAAGPFRIATYYLKVSATGTFNLATNTTGTDTYIPGSIAWVILTSSTDAFPVVPVKSSYLTQYLSGGYTEPSNSMSMASGDVTINFLATSEWTPDYEVSVTDFTPNGTAISTVTSVFPPKLKYLKSSKNTGTGSVACSFARTDTSANNNAVYSLMSAVFFESSYAITSVNAGAGVYPGQTNIPIVTSGFTVKPTTATATYSGNTITATVNSGGTASNFTINMPDRIDAQPWPVNGTSVLWTFSNSVPETASIYGTVVKKSTEILAPTFISPIIDDLAYLSAQLYADGFEVNGGELVVTSPNAGKSIGTLYADGNNAGSDLGTYPSWFRPASDRVGYTGRAGKVYAYDWTIVAASDVINTDPNPFTFGTTNNVVPSAVTVSSNQVTIAGTTAGVDCPTVPSGGLSYRISTNGGSTFGSWLTGNSTVQLGNVIEARMTAPSTTSTNKVGTLTIGTVSGNFTINTRAAVTVNAFSFGSVTHAETSTVTNSITLVTLQGSTPGAAVTATPSNGLEYRVSTNGGSTFGSWLSTATTVNIGNVLQARLTSSASTSTQVTGSLAVGEYGVVTTGTFSVSTWSGPTPDDNQHYKIGNINPDYGLSVIPTFIARGIFEITAGTPFPIVDINGDRAKAFGLWTDAAGELTFKDGFGNEATITLPANVVFPVIVTEVSAFAGGTLLGLRTNF